MAEVSAAAPFAIRFHRAYDVATVITVVLWQVGAAGSALVVYHGQYRSPGGAVVIWAVQLLVIAAGAGLLFRPAKGTTVAVLLVIDLATDLAMAVNCPAGELLRINWAPATTGLIGVLLLLHRRVREVVLLQAVIAAITLAVLVATDDLDRYGAAGFVTLLYASGSIQLAMITGAGVFRASGGMAAAAAAERWETARREAVIAEVSAARQLRYQEAREMITPVLRGLADGTVDPAEPAVRQRSRAAEAMLRQLLAEQEDIPDPVIRVLRPGVDEAMRRGVAVDLVMVGAAPALDERTAAALAEYPLAVLARTREHARVTVVVDGAGAVSVSVLADGAAWVPRCLMTGEVSVTSDRDGELLWLEVRWKGP
ncbi:hypothetical protein [Spirillospora sp. NBC_01491]|uniref:hypothetical protein n=1 Tax=Spirillospora sp. NBC_01491 TaxID=2976007 RepID=UPI002E330F42|nr:hypothetical protein [Spirillospora sp. NBC_01491]